MYKTKCAHCRKRFPAVIKGSKRIRGGRWKYCSEFCMRNSKDRRNKQHKRLAVLALLGGKCVWRRCGITDVRMLQIDHVHAEGRSSLRESGGQQYKMWNEILAGTYKRRVQLLCCNHNHVKRLINKENGPRPTAVAA